VVEYSNDGLRCRYYGSRPEPDTVFRYRRNMTVTIIAGSEPCEEESVEPPVEPPVESSDSAATSEEEPATGEPATESS
jgi:hypothetical protein